MKTAEDFFRDKIIQETELKEPITLSNTILNAEQTMRWAYEYAKIYAKEELQDLLDSGCHPEYLPKKIEDAIYYIDNPYNI